MTVFIVGGKIKLSVINLNLFMNKQLLEELKEKLEITKGQLEKELQEFADKDPKLKGDWDSRYPLHDGGIGSQVLEDAADEVEEFVTRLPIEYSLETRLKDVDIALEKIKKDGYGKCEKCGKEMEEERLRAYPEARTCIDCQK